MANYGGMSSALNVLGQALLRSADAEEARKAKAELLQEQLQQKREATLTNAQAQLDVARENAAARAADLHGKTPYYNDGLGLQGTLAANLGVPGVKVGNMMKVWKGDTAGMAPGDLEEAMRMIGTKEVKDAFARSSFNGAEYGAQQKGVAQREINTLVESLTKAGAKPEVISQAVASLQGAPLNDGWGNLYNGQINGTGRARLANAKEIAQLYGANRANGDSLVDDATMEAIKARNRVALENVKTDNRVAIAGATPIAGPVNVGTYQKNQGTLKQNPPRGLMRGPYDVFQD